ncbi:MAG TPA: uroporphyrinogen decarboxylase [Chloroflexi bacterium]|nr:uroporphyrinogen decarboxylase [Chloroflexota bacterium]
MFDMTKVDRLKAAIQGERVDRVPVALWRHFPGDDYRPEDLARATVDFQQRFDFDFVKVTPASGFCLKDWGSRDRWVGNLEGTREYTHYPIQSPDDWREIKPLDPTKGELSAQLRCLRLIAGALGKDTPFIQTIFSPLAQAKNLVGRDNLLTHLRLYPEAMHEGLQTITTSIARFIEAAIDTGIAGVFYAVQHAQYGLLAEDEYRTFGVPYDQQALEPAGSLWLNVLHLHGADVMFDLLADYPVQVINWHDRETRPTLSEAQQRFDGAVCGGIQQWDVMVRGAPDDVQKQAIDAMKQTGGRRFILGTGCVTPVIAPISNIRAAREAVTEG